MEGDVRIHVPTNNPSPQSLIRNQGEEVQVLVIAPNWPTQSWFPDLINYLVARLVKLPVFDKSTGSKLAPVSAPRTVDIQLLCVYNSQQHLRKSFSQSVARRISEKQRAHTGDVYKSKWQHLSSVY